MSIFEKQFLEIIFKEFRIILNSDSDSIKITIFVNDSSKIYNSSFNLNYLQTLNLFINNTTIKEILDKIVLLIYQNKIKFEEDKQELILNSIDKLFLEEFDNLEKISLKKKIKPISLVINHIKSINIHDDWVRSISLFPSGNIISVSNDKSIKIYNMDFNIIQIILNAHEKGILYVHIINENNFITCSKDKSIKFWIKKKINNSYQFEIKQIIQNAHNNWINKVINYQNKYVISCSNDKTVKIWEQINNNYQVISILKHEGWVNSVMLLEQKNILISSGGDGTKIWNLFNYNLLYHINGYCNNNNAIQLIDDDKIILGGYNGFINIISLSERRICHIINNEFFCLGIIVLNNLGIILIGGIKNEIKIYRTDNYECIYFIHDNHDKAIIGFCQLNNNSVITYGKDNKVSLLYINEP